MTKALKNGLLGIVAMGILAAWPSLAQTPPAQQPAPQSPPAQEPAPQNPPTLEKPGMAEPEPAPAPAQKKPETQTQTPTAKKPGGATSGTTPTKKTSTGEGKTVEE